MSIHALKIKSPWFTRVQAGQKHAEVRLHDRDYQAGDLLRLREVDQHGNTHTGTNPITARITHVLPASHCEGLKPGYCLLSIEVQ